MVIFNNVKYQQNICMFACSKALDEIFNAADDKIQDRGAIAFSVPLSYIHKAVEELPEGNTFGNHSITEYNFNEVVETLNTLVNVGKFANFYGAWIVADGTEYLKKHVHLKQDIPTEPTIVFIPEPAVIKLDELLS